MILLDTNAVLWLLTSHDRADPLYESGARLYLSPVSLLELKFLIEVGKISEGLGFRLEDLSRDRRWNLDSPAADQIFGAALDLSWTRDPFDRLLVAHAVCRRWRLATGDRLIQARAPESRVLAL